MMKKCIAFIMGTVLCVSAVCSQKELYVQAKTEHISMAQNCERAVRWIQDRRNENGSYGMGSITQTDELAESLTALQSEDGSYYGNLEATVAAVRLMKMIEEINKPRLWVTDMGTELSAYTAFIGFDTDIVVKSILNYQCNYDFAGVWKVEVLLVNGGVYDPETEGCSNACLFSGNQLAMIQTGHSNGQASDDERKVLANTLFYLKQLTTATSLEDKAAYDLESPGECNIQDIAWEENRLCVSLDAVDFGTPYSCYIQAVPQTEDAEAPGKRMPVTQSDLICRRRYSAG